MLGQKENSNTTKIYNKTLGNKPENTGERKKIKKISTNAKAIQTKLNIQKQRKKFSQQFGGNDTKTYTTTGYERN